MYCVYIFLVSGSVVPHLFMRMVAAEWNMEVDFPSLPSPTFLPGGLFFLCPSSPPPSSLSPPPTARPTPPSCPAPPPTVQPTAPSSPSPQPSSHESPPPAWLSPAPVPSSSPYHHIKKNKDKQEEGNLLPTMSCPWWEIRIRRMR